MSPAEVSHWNQELDRHLEATGTVNKELFEQFAYAHSHDASTSMQWLKAKLRFLVSRLGVGHPLSLYCPVVQTTIPVPSVEAFVRWKGKHFPNAGPV